MKTHSSESCATPGDSQLRFFPPRYARTYESWHDNLRDWCISRQLWWGHQIPVWRRAASPGSSEGSLTRDIQGVPVAVQVRSESGALHEYICLPPACPELEAHLESQGYERDPDVLDTWFSSALWPLSTLGWPEPPPEMIGLLEAFNPSNVLCTAREIITLWVSRMVMFNRYFTSPGRSAAPGQVPFKDVFIHAMIQDGEGRKMSKSLGNGVDPLDIVDSHGADAMRFTLCQMTTQTQDVRMPVERDPQTGKNTSPKFDFGRNFCTKLWNATRFALMNLDGGAAPHAAPEDQHGSDTSATSDLPLIDRWMLSRLAASIAKVDEAIREYQFSNYAQTMYDLLWRDFCDWYLEAIKPTVKQNAAQRAVLRSTLDTILRLLHPICPFITEVLHQPLRAIPAVRVDGLSIPASPRNPNLLSLAPWPQAAPSLINEAAEATFERLRALVGAIREARSSKNIDPKRRVTLHASPELATLIAQGGGLVETLALLECVATEAPAADAPAATLLFEARELALSGLADAVDPAVERQSLSEAVARLEKDIAVIEKRLSNPGYADKAPPKLVEETRQQLARKQAEREAAQRRLGELA